MPHTRSSIPLILPFAEVHSSAQVSSLYKLVEKCLPARFPTLRSHQVSAALAGASSHMSLEE